jgi:hypothetical protein
MPDGKSYGKLHGCEINRLSTWTFLRGHILQPSPETHLRPLSQMSWPTHLMHAGSTSGWPDRLTALAGLYPFGWV